MISSHSLNSSRYRVIDTEYKPTIQFFMKFKTRLNFSTYTFLSNVVGSSLHTRVSQIESTVFLRIDSIEALLFQPLGPFLNDDSHTLCLEQPELG